MYREFEVPDEQVLVDALGVEVVSESEDVNLLSFFEVTEEDLSFSYSVTGRSVRLLWRKESNLLMDVFREGATRLAVRTEGQSTSLGVEYGFPNAGGMLKVQIFPYVKVEDQLLLL